MKKPVTDLKRMTTIVLALIAVNNEQRKAIDELGKLQGMEWNRDTQSWEKIGE